MKYNVFYKTLLGNAHNILDIDREALNVITDAYLQGKNVFTISGKSYNWVGFTYIKIFTNSKELKSNDILLRANQKRQLFKNLSKEHLVYESFLSTIGDEVTAMHIGHKAFGEDKGKEKIVRPITELYIDESRINSLNEIKNESEFDLSKLIRLCEELNFNYSNENYYSVAMLGRAIIDHIPPIFGDKSFNSTYDNNPDISRSVKKNFKHLGESMRSIGDGILHSHIRRSESLPTRNQINFSQDLDVLLGEIVSYLKSK
ncbi:hypothetical protein [Flavobacterium sp. UBA4197]|uniref:hypothetical protein n=1 Tax=Flavobacterium sp. UBA4197 TaxID=1946546 RepID=UPI00257D4F77|nr:hypothetical protein [Flavobacterium sp. UBA4197]